MRAKEWAILLALATGSGDLMSARAYAACKSGTCGAKKAAAARKIDSGGASIKAGQDPFGHLGGMDQVKSQMKHNILASLFHPEMFEALGDKPPTGVLLSGPRLVGKTALLEATRTAIKARGGVALHADGHMLDAASVDALFDEAIAEATGKAEDDPGKPKQVGIFIDEIHALGGKDGRTALVAQVVRRVKDLQQRMEQDPEMKRVVVIGATDKPSAVDSSLTRKGMFEAPIEVSIPNVEERHDIFSKVTAKFKLAKGFTLKTIVEEKTRGWTGGDIAKLSRTALFNAVYRHNPKAEPEKMTAEALAKVEVGVEDFESAMGTVTPANMSKYMVKADIVHFDEVIGASEAKQQLQDVVKIIKNPEAAKALGAKIPRGVVMHGPPGNGKTMLAKAMATESGMNFMEIKPTVQEGIVGSSEHNLQEQIDVARQHAPVVVFIDEADSLFSARGSRPGDPVHDTLVNMLLANADGAKKLDGVVFVLATNRLELLDSALVGEAGQGGRFVPVHVGKPTPADRAAIFANAAKKMKIGSDVNFDKIVKSTNDWSGRGTADLMAIAARAALRRDAKAVEMKDFETALKEVGAKLQEEEQAAAKISFKK